LDKGEAILSAEPTRTMTPWQREDVDAFYNSHKL
jgi:hypothetical protein